MKILSITCLIIVGLAFLSCTSTHTHKVIYWNKLSNEEIEAYNNDPKNTDKIVCVNETSIGTRIPKRVCRKESSIAERSRHDQQTLQKIQSGVITKAPQGE